ncbi:hypothetical protein UO65_1772 [Actinokineospora spheciospongiae]|uniref:Uncharacterized protein n=1 Tax=Actinokineospora spheciospongiae TaxID=909613 RepID=W7IPV8_9PSEU|nr:hypothetical protein [Actinokineospora spheciospongiae]EWC62910.1 hypothetical protein UO65_1772 [Actinokineospora spheciospongiae]
MTQQRRVAVTSPQTRLAHARRRAHTAWRPSALDPADAERALRVFAAQRRRAAVAVAALGALVFGLPVLLGALPVLAEVRLLGIPVAWPALVLVPFPAMVWLARWHLRHAERVEDRP